MIDDAKFSPIFEFVQTENKVLMGHQGEPHNCWLPITAMTVNREMARGLEISQYGRDPAGAGVGRSCRWSRVAARRYTKDV